MDALCAPTHTRCGPAGIRVLPCGILYQCSSLSGRHAVVEPWWYPDVVAIYSGGLGRSFSGSRARGQGPELDRGNCAKSLCHTNCCLYVPRALARLSRGDGSCTVHLLSILTSSMNLVQSSFKPISYSEIFVKLRNAPGTQEPFMLRIFIRRCNLVRYSPS